MTSCETELELRAELKQATHHVHMALHKNILMAELLTPRCDLSSYKTVLLSFYAFHSWAKATGGAHFHQYFAEEANMLDWLNSDLKALDVNMEQAHKFLAELEKKLPTPLVEEPFSRYLGYLYVKQGSMLGAQVIAQKLQQNLSLMPQKNLFMFCANGEDSQLSWQRFNLYLNQNAKHVERRLVVQSALQHFATIKYILEFALNHKDSYDF